MLGYLSHEFRVPFITLQEGLYYAPAAVYRFHTEYSTACLVWGEATREVLVRSGGSADKIFVVGNTHLAPAVAMASRPETLRETRNELQIDPCKKVVTILMGGLGYHNEFTFPAEFLAWVRQAKDITILCKWHPVTNRTVLERITQSLQDIATFHSIQQYDTYRLLAVSDVCVVFGNSTTGLEALAFGKPLIEVQLDGLEYSFSRMGVAERATDLREVPAIVQRVLNTELSPERKDAVAAYLQDNLADPSGSSVERAVAVIEHVVAAQETHRQRQTLTMNFLQTPLDEDIQVSILSPQKKDHEQSGADSLHHHTYTCSIIIPLQSVVGLEETLVGIATHTPVDLSYECLLSTAQPEDVQHLLSGVGGDLRVVTASQPGIAHLCNVAAKTAKGQYLCFLPPGLIPQEGWLDEMLNLLETSSSTDHGKVGIIGGKALFTDGSVAHAGVAFDANCSLSFLYRFLPETFAGVNKIRVVPAVTGCFLVSREVFSTLGGMDEGLQQRLHDVDFCLHAQLAGWQTLYTPQSVCFALPDREENTVEDRLQFYGKWVGNLWPNEMTYWQEDGVNNKKLQQLYEGRVS
jgi:hypothetical protein